MLKVNTLVELRHEVNDINPTIHSHGMLRIIEADSTTMTYTLEDQLGNLRKMSYDLYILYQVVANVLPKQLTEDNRSLVLDSRQRFHDYMSKFSIDVSSEYYHYQRNLLTPTGMFTIL